MRALIVDDEPVARKILREELERLDSMEVAGEAASGQAALLQIGSLKPDLVFLDIQMPVMSGFDVLEQLQGGHLPAVIMVTAYDEHAIRAFEAGAIGYLLKPISQQRLELAVERARRVRRNPVQAAEDLAHLQEVSRSLESRAPKLRKIVGKLGDEYFLLSLSEVLAFQAEGDLIWIITAKQRYLATQNLRAVEERLTNSSFRRIHRNALVNIEHIRKLSMMTSQRWLITLAHGQEFIVSNGRRRTSGTYCIGEQGAVSAIDLAVRSFGKTGLSCLVQFFDRVSFRVP